MITSKKLTAERIAEIEKTPITYDDDSPKLTKKELAEFVPYHKEYFDINQSNKENENSYVTKCGNDKKKLGFYCFQGLLLSLVEF